LYFYSSTVLDPPQLLERQFPLAFSILTHTDFQLFELLLRSVYRPNNLYCVHVDAGADWQYQERVKNVVGCFDNVFMASQLVNVKWGTMSTFKPELVCMMDLLKMGNYWKYFINLTGQEMPLRTNFELVQLLNSIGGRNIVECEQYNE